MTNESLKAFIDEHGNKIFCILLNNNRKVFLGVERDPGNSVNATELQLKTVGGTDVFGIKHIDRTWNAEVPFTEWFVTGFIEGIFVTDEYGEHIPDINKIF